MIRLEDLEIERKLFMLEKGKMWSWDFLLILEIRDGIEFEVLDDFGIILEKEGIEK